MRAPPVQWLLLIAVGLLLSGCGLADLLPHTPLNDAPFIPEEQSPKAPANALGKQVLPRRAPVLRMPMTEPDALDPGTATDPATLDLLSALFEPLVLVDEDGEIREGNAERWQVSPDGRSYVFTLREGLRWWDGTPLTAQDYVWAWQRNITPASGAGYATMLYPIRNAQDIHAGRLDPATLGAGAIDDRTLEVTLSEPNTTFLSLTSNWVYMPLPRHIVEREGTDWANPDQLVGNGAYRIASWKDHQEIVLEPNPEYVGPHPARLERVELSIFAPDAEDAVLQAYQAGELDTTGTHFPLSGSELAQVTDTPELAQQLTTYDISATSFVVVNHRKPYLQDERVRRALGEALDRAALISETPGIPSTPALSLEPPGLGGVVLDRWPRENVAEAQRLLAEAGYPDGTGFPTLRYTYKTGAIEERIARYLRQRWRETLGITLQLETKDWRSFVTWQRSGEWERDGDLYRGSWMTEVEDTTSYYRTLWAAEGDAALLRSGWRNQRFDALVQQALAEPDPQRRASLHRQAEELLAGEYPSIPLYHYQGQMLVQPYVHGFTPLRILALTPWSAISIGPG